MGLKAVAISTLFTVTAWAQDSTYVHTINDKLSVQVFALNAANDFSLNYVNDGFEVDIVPNQKTTLNIGVQYDIASFSVGFAPSFFAENRDNNDSKMLSFSSTFYPGRFMQWAEVYYQRGMSLESESLGVTRYMPQLRSLKIGGSTSFVFNRNFSFRAVTLQNARQLRSQGSFVPSISYYYTALDGRKEPDLGARTVFIDVALEANYHYNWIIAKRFLLASGIGLGFGVNWTDDADNDYTALLSKANLMIAPGYNGERWFGGLQMRAQYTAHESKSAVAIGNGVGYFTGFVGYRFDAPPFLERQKNKVKGFIGL